MGINQNNYFSKDNKVKWSKLSNKKILVINTQWNYEIIKGMTDGAKKILAFADINKFDIVTAPGAYEIPFIIKKKHSEYDGIITIGCLIKGDTYHFEVISDSVSRSIMNQSVELAKPITFGIITVNNEKQALDRCGKTNNKGVEAAAALLDLFLIT